MTTEDKPIGLTKDAGFQIGVRRTLHAPEALVWELLFSAKGLNIWLGPTQGFNLETTDTYELDDGAAGEVRVFKPGSHARLTWQPGNYPRGSTIQVRVIGKEDKTTIAFHQEHLPDSAARAERRDHYQQALDELEEILITR